MKNYKYHKKIWQYVTANDMGAKVLLSIVSFMRSVLNVATLPCEIWVFIHNAALALVSS